MATIITVYKQPRLVELLLNAMQHPGFHFYLHIDKKVDMREFSHLFTLPNVFVIDKRVDIKWAGYSMIEALLHGMEQVLASGIRYDLINHMSAQCYPLKSADELYHFFEAKKNNILLSCHSAPSAWWDEARQRHERYNFHELSLPGRHRLGALLTFLLPKRTLQMFPTLYGGPLGAYWTITTDAATYLVQLVRKNKNVAKFFKLSWGPDEIMFNSIIMNSQFSHQVINDNNRYIDWSAGGAHPKTLTMDDLDKVMNSGCLFARKFDLTVDAKIVTAINKYILP